MFCKFCEYKIAQFKNAHKVKNSLKNGIIVTNEHSIINILLALCYIIAQPNGAKIETTNASLASSIYSIK